MDLAAAFASEPTGVVFQDGIGERHQVVDPAGDALEVLCLRSELTDVPAFEFALRERTGRLAAFRQPYFAHVRSVDRLSDQQATLALVSDRTAGIRLSEILEAAEAHHLGLDINAALCLARQLVPAVATLHEHAPDVAHGAIGPERIIVSPNGRLVIVEHVMGAALEQLRYSHERYWKELRIALPRSAGLPRFDHRADVMQIGVVALSLILGRVLRDDEYPARLSDVVSSAWAISSRGGLEPLPAGLRAWLARALQLDLRSSFSSASEARADLDKVLGDSDYIAAPAAVEAFLEQYHAAVDPPPATAPAPPAAPVRPVQKTESTPAVAASPIVIAPPAGSVPPAPPPQIVHLEPAEVPDVWNLVAPLENDDADVENADADEDDDMAQPNRRLSRRSLYIAAAAVGVIALVGGGIYAARRGGLGAAFAAAPATGTLTITTNPPGAQLAVDGEAKGITPLTLALKTGAHTLDLRGVGEPRTIPVTIAAGAQVSQYIELPKTASATGQLQVRTEPAGAVVTVDGVPRGPSPAVVTDLTPGPHTVSVEGPLGAVKQTVTVEAGITASLVMPLSTPDNAPVSGWISVTAPVDVQLYENKRLLGSSQSDRIMVSAGRHDIEIVNDIIGYHITRTVQVPAGKVAPIKIDLPKGTIALNAIPWAEVWIDGEKVGETPIGNLAVSIGPHEVIFRNPELGEQRNAVTVTLSAPARLSVDLRKK
jgi:PEGA domain-containing protein